MGTPGRIDRRPSPETLAEICRLRRQNWSYQRIGDHLGLHNSTICRWMQRINAKAWARLIKDEAAVRGDHLARLEELAFQAQQEWDRSRTDAEKVQTKETDAGSGQAGLETTTTTTVEGRLGDPRYLEEIRKVLADIRQLAGLTPDAAIAKAVQSLGPYTLTDDRFDPDDDAEADPGGNLGDGGDRPPADAALPGGDASP